MLDERRFGDVAGEERAKEANGRVRWVYGRFGGGRERVERVGGDGGRLDWGLGGVKVGVGVLEGGGVRWRAASPARV